MREHEATAPEDFPEEGLYNVEPGGDILAVRPSHVQEDRPEAHDLVRAPATGRRQRALAEKKARAPELFRHYRGDGSELSASAVTKPSAECQQKQHKYKKRNAKRAASSSKEDVLGTKVKRSAIRRHAHLVASTRRMRDDPVGDSTEDSSQGRGPIYTSMSLDRTDVPLACSSQIGRLLPVTAADRERVGFEDLPKHNLRVEEWDGM